MFRDLTVVIPVKEPPNLPLFINSMKWLLLNSKVITCDSGGGKCLQEFSWKYIQKQVSMWIARRICYELVETPYTLNLDCDVYLPHEYVLLALETLRTDKAEAIAIHFDPLKTGHLEFGTSLWKSEVLKKLYDYCLEKHQNVVKVGEMLTTVKTGFCECAYMWRKLKLSGGRLETLPFRAKHLK